MEKGTEVLQRGEEVEGDMARIAEFGGKKKKEKLAQKEELEKEELKRAKLVKEEEEEKLVYESDSDDDDDDFRISKETRAKMEANYLKINASDGFDAEVIDDPHYYGIRAFSPTRLELWMDDLLFYSNCAIQTYNNDYGKKLKVVEVVKAVYLPLGRYKEFNLTFTAKDAAAAIYQARLHSITTDLPVDVKFCRLAPFQALPSSS